MFITGLKRDKLLMNTVVLWMKKRIVSVFLTR